MAKHKDIELGNEHFERLSEIARRSALDSARFLEMSRFLASSFGRSDELRKTKSFRFQLMHRWLVAHLEPCRVADVGGGKGLLSYLLQTNGWQATVIDPVNQPLPDKYKDIETGNRVRIAADKRVPRIDRGFETRMGGQFDLLIGMHAHGCNVQIIEAAVTYGCGFVLFPCCVIDEPFYPPIGVHWLESLAEYATGQGLEVYPFRLNFRGQNIGLCTVGRCPPRKETSVYGDLRAACTELADRIIQMAARDSGQLDKCMVSAWIWIFTGTDVGPANRIQPDARDRQLQGNPVSEGCFDHEEQDLRSALKDDLASQLAALFENCSEQGAHSAVNLLQNFASLLQNAQKLRDHQSGLDAESFAIRGAAIEDRLDSLIDEAKSLSLLNQGAAVRRDLLQRRAAMLRFMYSE